MDNSNDTEDDDHDDVLGAFIKMEDESHDKTEEFARRRRTLARKRSTLVGPDVFQAEENHNIANDVYNIFFLSEIGGQGFFFAMYIFALKLVIYSLLMTDTMRNFYALGVVPMDVRIAQFLMLPACVAMQGELMATFFVLAHVKYCPSVLEISQEATKTKYILANLLRGIDGLYSLTVNFAVLLIADDVLPLFLHFAGFVFVQNIEKLALDMAEGGYLTRHLERVAYHVKRATLPCSHDKAFSVLGSALFMSTVFVLFILWTAVVAMSP